MGYKDYRNQKLEYLRGIYLRYTEREEWENSEDASDFYGIYKVLYDAFKSIPDNPHVWVRVSLNESLEKWTEKLDNLIIKGAKTEKAKEMARYRRKVFGESKGTLDLETLEYKKD